MIGFWIRTSLVLAAGLVGLSLLLVAVSDRASPAGAGPHLISMDESAAAMKTAGETMRRHGEAMLSEGTARADQRLTDHGKHWIADGDALILGGAWMAMNPTAPGSLAATPDELAENANWTALNRAVRAMLHDPSKARQIDAEALHWNGVAMRDEGRIMTEHARVMMPQVEMMSSYHQLDDATMAELRAAVEAMRISGGHLTANGQSMMEFAGRLHKGIVRN